MILQGQLPSDAFVGIWASEDNKMCWVFLKPESKLGEGRSIWGDAYVTFTACKPVPNGSFVGDWHKTVAPTPDFAWTNKYRQFLRTGNSPNWEPSSVGNIRLNPKQKDADGYPTTALAAYARGNDYSADWTAVMSYVGSLDQIKFGSNYSSSMLLCRITFPSRSTSISKGSFFYDNVQYDLECDKPNQDDPTTYSFKFINRSTGDLAGGGKFQWNPSASYLKGLRGGTSDGVDQLLVTFGFEGGPPKHGVFKAAL